MELKDIKLTPLLDTLQLVKISDAVYFSPQYSHYVSNSRLGLINPRQGGDPDKFFEGFKGEGYMPAFELGSAVHELVLQPEYFELAGDLGKPTAKLGAMADALYPKFLGGEITSADVIEASNKVGYYKGKMTETKIKDVIEKSREYWQNRQKDEFDLSQDKEVIFLDHKSRETVLSCVEALQTNEAVQKLLHPEGILETPISENEQTIVLDVRAECPNGKTFTLHLKSKLDNYTIDKESNIIVVNDIKTIGKVVSEIDNNIRLYRYSREMAMYIYLLKLYAEKFQGMVNPKIRSNYLVVSTIPDFYSKVRPVTYGEIREGFHEFQILLKYVAYQIAYHDYSLDGNTSKYQL